MRAGLLAIIALALAAGAHGVALAPLERSIGEIAGRQLLLTADKQQAAKRPIGPCARALLALPLWGPGRPAVLLVCEISSGSSSVFDHARRLKIR